MEEKFKKEFYVQVDGILAMVKKKAIKITQESIVQNLNIKGKDMCV